MLIKLKREAFSAKSKYKHFITKYSDKPLEHVVVLTLAEIGSGPSSLQVYQWIHYNIEGKWFLEYSIDKDEPYDRFSFSELSDAVLFRLKF